MFNFFHIQYINQFGRIILITLRFIYLYLKTTQYFKMCVDITRVQFYFFLNFLFYVERKHYDLSRLCYKK